MGISVDGHVVKTSLVLFAVVAIPLLIRVFSDGGNKVKGKPSLLDEHKSGGEPFCFR